MLGDNRAAEASVDEVLTRERHNLRGLIIKGDLLLGRDERRNVVRGEVWAFDDSINHEAWNNSADDRIVLIFDVWHPDLTEQERRDITSLLEAVSA